MDGTPIFDELRGLFGRPPDWLDTSGTPDADLRAETEPSSPEAGGPPVRIIVTGGRGVGKTTFVGSVSDLGPLNVESATDFGRITLHPDLVLHLFGTSEPARSGFRGALGAVVLVDIRQIEDTFATISYFESASDVLFIVAVNVFDGELCHELDEVREALALSPDVPLTTCDARDPVSAAKVLRELVSYTMKAGASDHSSPPAAESGESGGEESQ